MTSSDPVANALLVHADFVQRLARGLSGADGDDLAQDTWAAALQAPVADVRSLRAWLATIAANLWRNGQRASARRVRREVSAEVADGSPSIPEILEREEVRRQVVAAVVELPERLRRVVLLRFYEGLDSFAIGRRLDVPASTVRAQLAQALTLLRQRLDAGHGDRRAAWALPLAGWLKAPMSSWFCTLLRVMWPVRAVCGAIAVLLLAWLSAPLWWQPPIAPPALPIGPGEVAVVDREKSAQEAGSSPERVSVAAAVEEVARGPEDLWGRVVAASDGAPISGAEVVLEHREADEITSLDPDYDNQVEILGTSRTDSEGRFAFRVQRAFQHRFVVRAAGYAPVVEIWCTGGSEFVVRLDRAAFVEGTVRRKVDGTPLADVLVEAVVRDVPAGNAVQARTSADGAFFLAGVPPKPCSVRVIPSGLRPPAAQLVALAPGKGARLEFLVENGRAVRGVIRDAETKLPITEARIATSRTMRDAVVSAADGSYACLGIAHRGSLYVRAAGYADQVQPVATQEEQVHVDFALSRGSIVIGRVVDRDGRALKGTYVAAAMEQYVRAGAEHHHWCQALVDADGRFRIEGLANLWTRADEVVNTTPWQLLVRAPATGTRVLALPSFQASEGVIDVGDVVLQPQAILEGRLVEADGRGIANAIVALSGHARDFGRLLLPGADRVQVLWHFANRQTRTASDGSFRFASLAAGVYQVRGQIDDNQDWSVPGQCEVRDGEILTLPSVVVDAGLTIEGTVRIAGLVALPAGQRVSLYAHAEHDEQRGLTAVAKIAGDGTFRIVRLPEGTYVLSALDVPAGFAMELRPGVAAGTKNVELMLVVVDVIEGRVIDQEDKPVRGVGVTFWPRGGHIAKPVVTGADGRFRLEVAPGVVGRVNATDPNVVLRQVMQGDVAAGTRDLVLRLSR